MRKGTVRPIIWEKTNPSPMNGQYIYLSGVEMAVWFKKSGAKHFNAHCKILYLDTQMVEAKTIQQKKIINCLKS